MADEGLCFLPDLRSALPQYEQGTGQGEYRLACEIAANLTQAGSHWSLQASTVSI